MEEQKSNNNTTLAVAGLVALGLVGLVSYKLMNSSTPKVDVAVSKDKKTVQVTQTFKDGTYNKTGKYMTPGGPEEIGVSLTVEKGKVKDVVVTNMANLPASKKFQDNFISGAAGVVVGKDLATLNLDKVAGSSLSPKGFNDAVMQIKQDAQS